MIKNSHVFILSVIFLSIAFILVSCAPPGTASVSEDYIRNLAQDKMHALNEGDYASFCQDFSDLLKEAFTKEEFIDFRETVLNTSGRFETITNSRISRTQDRDYVAYIFSTRFEEENVTLTLVYAIDGDLVEGIFFNAPKLNQALQSQ
ncbi:MAG: DUF3887 domain-containing protein [Anaerolineales bacterium]|nr:DUF3887 domain-containing protein [Anaerolineales bacterium]